MKERVKEEKKVTAEERRRGGRGGRKARLEAVKKEMSNTTMFIKTKQKEGMEGKRWRCREKVLQLMLTKEQTLVL